MKIVIAAVLFIVVVVFGLSVYLAPNDLASCKSDTPTVAAPCQSADAIVAISGGDTQARTQEAIKLYKNGWGSKLIFSGAAQDKSGPSNAAVMRQQAMSEGIPESDILIEETSETTKQNADQTQKLLDDNGINKIILVTSGYHQRRASLEFDQRAAGKVTIVNHPVATDKQWSGFWWLTPQGWYLAVSEFFKIIAFYLGGSR